jgi:5-(carboxyamino)imidazole ribonucleotide synthase
VDKAHQRTVFAAAGLPVPDFLVVDNADDPAIDTFVTEHPLPVVKAATGGYDGRGVLFPTAGDEARAMVASLTNRCTVVIEERVTLLLEVAQMVARGVDGTVSVYPLVTTVQRDGMCSEVQFPTDLEPALVAEADALTLRIAELVDLVGVMAVEYFVTPTGLVINELALRPHNSGHWTIEGCATSQFANHLLAVSGHSLGDATPVVPCAVMVNVVGAEQPGSLARAIEVAQAHVHDYGKSWRPQRKLGHVTVVGDDLDHARSIAWASAHAYGTSTQENP